MQSYTILEADDEGHENQTRKCSEEKKKSAAKQDVLILSEEETPALPPAPEREIVRPQAESKYLTVSS